MPRQLLALALLLAACDTDDTILPGTDPCDYASRAVSADDATIGVSADEALALSGVSTFEATYDDGAKISVTAGATAPSSGATLYESASGACEPYLGVPVELDVTTDDGLLDGVWTVELQISLEEGVPVAVAAALLDPEELGFAPELLEGETLRSVSLSAAWTSQSAVGLVMLHTETETETAVADGVRTLLSWSAITAR